MKFHPKLYLHRGKLSWLKQPALKAIQFGTDSEYFHVGLEYDERLIAESTSKRGVDIRPLDHYYKLAEEEDRIIDVFECIPSIDEDLYKDVLIDKIGLKYDFWGVFGVGLLKITKDLKWKKLQKERDYF